MTTDSGSENDDAMSNATAEEVEVVVIDDDDTYSEETSVIAGTLRNILSRSLKMFSGEHSNRLFSKKMLIKVISKSQIHDVSEHYSAIKSEAKHYYKNAAVVTKKKQSATLLKTVGFATMYILKSIILGGAVFAIYEESWSRLQSLFPPTSKDAGGFKISKYDDHRALSLLSCQYYLHVVHPGVLSTASGLFAGASHGGLYYMMKRIVHLSLARFQAPLPIGPGMTTMNPKPLPKLLSAMVSHSLVYGTLFGFYDFTKQSSLYAMRSYNYNNNNNNNVDLFNKLSPEMEGVISVIIGATVAGIASEMVNSITHPMETTHLRSFFLRRKRKRRRSAELYPRFSFIQHFRGGRYFKGLVPTVGSTVAGFLAYEYAKQIIDGYIASSDIGRDTA